MSGSSIYETVFDCAGKQHRIEDINGLMAAADFWDDQEKAQSIVGELSRLNGVLRPMDELQAAVDDLEVLLEFAEEEDGEASEEEIRTTLTRLTPQLEAAELQAIMSDPADASNAYLKVQAGEGGTDASDWAEMLLRMYLRWAERRGFKAEVVDRSDAEEAGIRNATVLISGDYAFGWLKGENGNHRLIRISPFDSAGRRQTSFAAVDVTPEADESIDIDIDWDKDVREDTMRAGGAGGQHVNKTESAIRLTHLETNTVVYCQNERSQHQNRANARKMLLAKLYQMEVERRDAENAARRGEKSRIGFGGETARHYVLHPEQYVKDARTGQRVGQPDVVLDGDIDQFLEGFLRGTMGEGSSAGSN